MNLRNLVYLSGFVLLAVMVWLITPSLFNSDFLEDTACTEEARLCPDGSSVARVAPSCEFAACPGGVSLKTFADPTGNSFEYPDGFGGQYLDALDWPPVLVLAEDSFSCVESGSESAPSGRTELLMIDDREYCVTKISESAADNVYTQYAYAFPSSSGTAILAFSTRLTDCDDLNESDRATCEAEQSSFDVGSIIDRIARSIRFGNGSTTTE